MKDSATKTNAMRQLDRAGIPYRTYLYELDAESFSGVAVSRILGLDPECCFKSLCAKGSGKSVYVFCIPVSSELDLKRAAAAAGEKSVELAAVKDLKELTGYERGSVSPVGLKKPYPVFIDETAQLFDEIEISGGAKGVSLMLNTEELTAFVNGSFAALTQS